MEGGDAEAILPGTQVHISGDYVLGQGLYTWNGSTYASRMGVLSLARSAAAAGVEAATEGGAEGSLEAEAVPTTVVSVARGASGDGAGRTAVPSIGDTIIGTVNKLTPRYVGVDICVANRTHLGEPFKGTLRCQDIWPPEQRDAPSQINLAMRPGDLIRARIIGLGDASAGFLLSTALDERLGVIFAHCLGSGEALVPISWNQMVCPRTGIREYRKPARPTSVAPGAPGAPDAPDAPDAQGGAKPSPLGEEQEQEEEQ